MSDKNSNIPKVYGTDNEIRFLPNTLNIRELDKGVYKINVDMRGYFFTKIAVDFKLPPAEKIYSNDNFFIDHVLKTIDSEKNKDVNIILEGKKGLGKSFTAKILANQVSFKYNCPIIIIDKNGEDIQYILEFLNNFSSRFVLFIDEFEKIFPENTNNKDGARNYQNSFLSFLDGSSHVSNNKIVIATSNTRLSNYFYNRPSRFRYIRKYNGLSFDLINEVIDKNLINKNFKKDLLSNIYPTCNIDVLEQIINEINTFNKPYSDFKSFFNHSNEHGAPVHYQCSFDINNKRLSFVFKTSRYLDDNNKTSIISVTDKEVILNINSYIKNEIENNNVKFSKLFKNNKNKTTISKNELDFEENELDFKIDFSEIRIENYDELTNLGELIISVHDNSWNNHETVTIEPVQITQIIQASKHNLVM